MYHLIGESYVHGLMDGEGYAEFLARNEEGTRHLFSCKNGCEYSIMHSACRYYFSP